MAELRPDRARCRRCAATQVLLPAWYVPRRSCDVEIVGAALTAAATDGRGHRGVAKAEGVPAGTVRGWLRGARRGACALVSHAVDVTGAGVGRVWAHNPFAPRQQAVEVLDALADCAAELAAPPPVPRSLGSPGSLTGIDHLAALASQYYRERLQRLHVADPDSQIASLPVWQLINLACGGRLLSFAPSG